jgi:hypothetical protein
MYSIEFNDYVKSFICGHCGEQSVTVWGWVAKDNTAHGVYYAGLMTGHADASVHLTLSIGGWGEPDNSPVRRWCFIEVRPTADSCEMMVCEPEESQYFGKPLLGTAMSRAETLSSTLKNEFFAVVDFIVFNDPAVRSYLVGEEVSSVGRKGFAPLASG